MGLLSVEAADADGPEGTLHAELLLPPQVPLSPFLPVPLLPLFCPPFLPSLPLLLPPPLRKLYPWAFPGLLKSNWRQCGFPLLPHHFLQGSKEIGEGTCFQCAHNCTEFTQQ